MKMNMMISLFVLQVIQIVACDEQLNRCNFPDGFIFGAASSAYQFEGAVAEGGRKPSLWDIKSREGNIADHSNGDIAVDQYHRFKDDVLLLKDLGMDVYRFSISWSRFFPDDKVNSEGLDYYNSLINTLLEQGIQPFVTIYHWDLPQAFEDSFGGWLSPKIIEKYKMFAEACFDAFGDRVMYWTTFNEPYTFLKGDFVDSIRIPNETGTKPYIAAHHVLLSHAAVVQLYREKYQKKMGGKIGITLDFQWQQPYSNSSDDEAAAQRMNDFTLGWFLNPLVYGDYPAVMRTNVGERLPKFTREDVRRLVNSFDFLGINYYISSYARNNPMNRSISFENDLQVQTTVMGLNVPLGIRKILNYVKKNYGDPEIIITENGYPQTNNPTNTLYQSLQDPSRIFYHREHLSQLLKAMSVDGVKVRGYIAWALLDNWEWLSGFSVRYGLYYIDYLDDLKRYPKSSAIWFKELLNCNQNYELS